MNFLRFIILFSFLCILLFTQAHTVNAFPASSFTFKDGDWYDNWGIDRNNYEGSNGYLPKLATETLNGNRELAYTIGERFQSDYASNTDRAMAILRYVQTWTEYGFDSDNVVRNGVPQDEWAWNADEMAHSFNETTGVKAIGDCEDMAFLCGTIYVAAGFDAAIVDAPEHAALLIWLPEFSNANDYWDLPNDGKDAGWIWVEATGNSNPLGWTPPDFENGGWTAYPIGNLQFASEPQPTSSTLMPIDMNLLLMIIVVIFFVLIALSRSRRH
jgi:hypothetical protein